MVYGVSGLRMACAVNIVIYYDDISIRSCTIAGSLFHGFDVTPCAVPAASPCALGQNPNLVAEAWHWILGTARHQQQGGEHPERLHQCRVRPFSSSTTCSTLRA